MDIPVSLLLLLLLLLLEMQAPLDLTLILIPSFTLSFNRSTGHPSPPLPPQMQPCILDPQIQ